MDTRVFDPTRDDFTPYGFACDRWQPGPMTRPDRHNEIELNFVVEGSFTYLVGGRRERIGIGQLALFWAAAPHQIIAYTEDCHYYVATVPLAWFLSWQLDQQFVQAVLAGRLIRSVKGARHEPDHSAFQRWTEDFAKPDAQRLRAAALEMQARISRLSMDFVKAPERASPQPLSQPSSGAGKIEAIAAWIAQHYRERVRLADVGAAVDLHPNYAANLFRQTFGTTINAYITAHRVAHAQRLLMLTDDKILAIALASGFNTLSRFNAAFRKACGCTPREYRRNNRGRAAA